MKNESIEAERAMAALFNGLTRIERMALLGRLEMAGASIYRALAEGEQNAKAREALLGAADNEGKNGALLRLMSTAKERCEKCGTAIAQAGGGFACTFQCTFCEPCAAGLKMACPNCGGPLAPRRELQSRL
jgi:hypothetical protein